MIQRRGRTFHSTSIPFELENDSLEIIIFYIFYVEKYDGSGSFENDQN